MDPISDEEDNKDQEKENSDDKSQKKDPERMEYSKLSEIMPPTVLQTVNKLEEYHVNREKNKLRHRKSSILNRVEVIEQNARDDDELLDKGHSLIGNQPRTASDVQLQMEMEALQEDFTDLLSQVTSPTEQEKLVGELFTFFTKRLEMQHPGIEKEAEGSDIVDKVKNMMEATDHVTDDKMRETAMDLLFRAGIEEEETENLEWMVDFLAKQIAADEAERNKITVDELHIFKKVMRKAVKKIKARKTAEALEVVDQIEAPEETVEKKIERIEEKEAKSQSLSIQQFKILDVYQNEIDAYQKKVHDLQNEMEDLKDEFILVAVKGSKSNSLREGDEGDQSEQSVELMEIGLDGPKRGQQSQNELKRSIKELRVKSAKQDIADKKFKSPDSLESKLKVFGKYRKRGRNRSKYSSISEGQLSFPEELQAEWGLNFDDTYDNNLFENTKTTLESAYDDMEKLMEHSPDLKLKTRIRNQLQSVIDELENVKEKKEEANQRILDLIESRKYREQEIEREKELEREKDPGKRMSVHHEMILRSIVDDLRQLDTKQFFRSNSFKRKDGKFVNDEAKILLIQLKRMLIAEKRAEVENMARQNEKLKEKHDAMEWKQEKLHREDMLKTFKAVTEFMEFINRFKDNIGSILAAAEFVDAAEKMQNIPRLITQDGNPNIGEKMENSKVVLNSIESVLGEALGETLKNLEEKEHFIIEQLKMQLEASEKARNAISESMRHKRMSVTQRRAVPESDDCKSVKFKGGGFGLLDKYRRMVYQNCCLQKNISQMEAEMKHKLKESTHKVGSISCENSNLAHVVEAQNIAIKAMENLLKLNQKNEKETLKVKVAEAKHVLKLLDNVFVEDVITKEMNELMADLMKQSIELSQLKLKDFFKRYVTFRRLQGIKDEVLQQIKHDKNLERQKRMMKFIDNIEKKITEVVVKRQEAYNVLEERFNGSLSLVASTFHAVLVNDDMLKHLPKPIDKSTAHCKQQHRAPTVDTDPIMESNNGIAPSNSENKKPQGLLPEIKCPKKSQTLSSLVSGVTMKPTDVQMWSSAESTELPPFDKNMVELPKLLEVDVKRRLRGTQRATQDVRAAFMRNPEGLVSGYDWTNKVVTPIENLFPNRGYIYITKELTRPKQFTRFYDPMNPMVTAVVGESRPLVSLASESSDSVKNLNRMPRIEVKL